MMRLVRARRAFGLLVCGAMTWSPAEAEPAPAAAPVTLPGPTIVAPKLESDPAVPYPEGASGDATVVLTLTVNADGTVQNAVPLEINEPFSSQAVGAALSWTFDAATRNGSPVAAKIRVEVIFREPPKQRAG